MLDHPTRKQERNKMSKQKRRIENKKNKQPRRKNIAENRAVTPQEKGVVEYTVSEPTELLKFLLTIMPNRSRNSVKSILARGQVSVDNQVLTQYNHPIKTGQKVGVLSNKEAIKKTALAGIRILHEDDDIIVIDKEAGLLSIAANDPEEMTAYRQLSQYVKEDNPDNRIFIVHRLDRDTSGVMIYAKSEEIKLSLQKEWKENVKERLYTALVEGVVENEQGTMASWLTENKAMHVFSNPTDNGGQYAVTNYRKVLESSTHTLLEVELETGRKNQIRVHMQDMGHPIVGDKRYGAESDPMNRLGLHATTLVLVHPRTNKLVRYTASVPPVFLKLAR